MKKLQVSVIVSFYNKIEYLRLIVAALERQSFKDFELVIADDGSGSEVVAEIKRMIEQSSLITQHVWHEDLGFRKTKIFNEAIRRSRSPYLIFMDGDCIPHSKFVEGHYENRAPKELLAGRRVYLSEKLSVKLTVDKIRNGYMDNSFLVDLLVDGVFGKSSHVIKGVYVANPFLRRILNRSMTGVLGSNFSVHKQDMEAINGFDERYEAPAVGEDSDIEVRLGWNHVKIRMVKNVAVQYHLHHKKLPRPDQNLTIFEGVKKEKIVFTPYGLIKENATEGNHAKDN